jgi:hypothetical protein
MGGAVVVAARRPPSKQEQDSARLADLRRCVVCGAWELPSRAAPPKNIRMPAMTHVALSPYDGSSPKNFRTETRVDAAGCGGWSSCTDIGRVGGSATATARARWASEP